MRGLLNDGCLRLLVLINVLNEKALVPESPNSLPMIPSITSPFASSIQLKETHLLKIPFTRLNQLFSPFSFFLPPSFIHIQTLNPKPQNPFPIFKQKHQIQFQHMSLSQPSTLSSSFYIVRCLSLTGPHLPPSTILCPPHRSPQSHFSLQITLPLYIRSYSPFFFFSLPISSYPYSLLSHYSNRQIFFLFLFF